MNASSNPLLRVNNIEVIYDHVILVLKGVSLEVPKGAIVSILGANGAGKTTTLKAVSNLLRSERGEVTKGTIEYNGGNITDKSPADLVKDGVVQVMEGRHCFEHLTVEENLLTGAYTRKGGRSVINEELEKVYHYFPRLKERRTSLAGYVSGGEQQMLAIGRALVGNPNVLLMDEPSEGLAPVIVEELQSVMNLLREESSMTIVLVEQNSRVALEFSERCIVMNRGRIVRDGSSEALRQDQTLLERLIGVDGSLL